MPFSSLLARSSSRAYCTIHGQIPTSTPNPSRRTLLGRPRSARKAEHAAPLTREPIWEIINMSVKTRTRRLDMDASGLDPADALNFWPPAICALATATLLAIFVLVTVKPINPSRNNKNQWHWLGRLLAEVNASDAWSPQGSWTTNITAIGAVLGTVAGTTSALQSYIPNSGAFVAVSLVFGGAAVLAPVIYAALATSIGISDPGGEVSGALGTVGGLLLAAIFTLFGFFGEIFITLEVAIHAVSGQQGPEAFFWASILLAALLVAIYSYRSLKDMILILSHATCYRGIRSRAEVHYTASKQAFI